MTHRARSWRRSRSLRALVVGDVCLDRWCRYDPALAEPSRETGIPRIGVVATEVTPGAAGTVANNLAALGAGQRRRARRGRRRRLRLRAASARSPPAASRPTCWSTPPASRRSPTPS